MSKPKIILIGGFLGAGKTSLIQYTTALLKSQGHQIGIITNDQASELVDTALLGHSHEQVSEVSGSCFCCNYNAFLESINTLSKNGKANLILAEPVGSCTDLYATILQPLIAGQKQNYAVAPLTVVADPARLSAVLNNGHTGLHPSSEYIYKKQLAESDFILLSKSDLFEKSKLESLSSELKSEFPNAFILPISSQSGEGISEWLRQLESASAKSMGNLEVDYDTYAEGEAVLGWLNTSIQLSGKQVDWKSVITQLMHALAQRFEKSRQTVGHLKLILSQNEKFLLANLTGSQETLRIQGNVEASDEALLIINARISTNPNELELSIRSILHEVMGDDINLQIKAWRCLSPGYPNPTFRFINGRAN